MAIAPTASHLASSAAAPSPGIEPIAANVLQPQDAVGLLHRAQPVPAEAAGRSKGGTTRTTWTSITVTKGSVQHLDFLTEQEKAIFKTAFELDQRWVVEHAADRTPFICQSQSVNLFLPANVAQARPAPDPLPGVEEGREVALLLPLAVDPARRHGQREGGVSSGTVRAPCAVANDIAAPLPLVAAAARRARARTTRNASPASERRGRPDDRCDA